MRYKQFLFPEEYKKNKWPKFIWKWTKIALGIFIIVSTIWGCAQILGDKTVGTGYINSVYDFKKHNIAAVFFEFLIGSSNVFKNHTLHVDISNGTIYEYPFNGIENWQQAWTITKSPFYGLFVYPIAWLLVKISTGLGGGVATKPVAIIFAIFFTTLIIKLLNLVFAFKAQQSNERMQAVQLKVSEIQAKYKFSRDPQAKQKMQMEIMAVYKKENVSPVSSLVPTLLSIPFLTAMFNVIRSTNILKTASVGSIKLIEQPWGMLKEGHFIYLIIVGIYIPIQFVSVFLPMYLNRAKQKVKTRESKAALRKQILINSLVAFAVPVVFVFSTNTGLGIYWIISGALQILQTIGFHLYNKNKRSRYKRKGHVKENFGKKFQKLFNRLSLNLKKSLKLAFPKKQIHKIV